MAARFVEVQKHPDEMGYGFTVTGEQPAVLSVIQEGSAAHRAGLKAYDTLVGINGEDVSTASHEKIVALVGRTRASIRLVVVSQESARSIVRDGRNGLEGTLGGQQANRSNADAVKGTGGGTYLHASDSDLRRPSSGRPTTVSPQLSSGDSGELSASADIQRRPQQRRSLYEAVTSGSLTSTGSASLSGHHTGDSHSSDRHERSHDSTEAASAGSRSPSLEQRRAKFMSSKSTSLGSLPVASEGYPPPRPEPATSAERYTPSHPASERHTYPVNVAYFGGVAMSARLMDKDDRLRVTRECINRARQEYRKPRSVIMNISSRGIQLIVEDNTELIFITRSSITLTWVDTNDDRVFALVERHGSIRGAAGDVPLVNMSGHVFKVLPSVYQSYQDPQNPKEANAWPIIRLLKVLYGGKSDKKPQQRQQRPGSAGSRGSSASMPVPSSTRSGSGSGTSPTSERRPAGALGGAPSVLRAESGPPRVHVEDTLSTDSFGLGLRGAGSRDAIAYRPPSASSTSAVSLRGRDEDRSSSDWDIDRERGRRRGSDPDHSAMMRLYTHRKVRQMFRRTGFYRVD